MIIEFQKVSQNDNIFSTTIVEGLLSKVVFGTNGHEAARNSVESRQFSEMKMQG